MTFDTRYRIHQELSAVFKYLIDLEKVAGSSTENNTSAKRFFQIKPATIKTLLHLEAFSFFIAAHRPDISGYTYFAIILADVYCKNV